MLRIWESCERGAALCCDDRGSDQWLGRFGLELWSVGNAVAKGCGGIVLAWDQLV